MPAQDLHTQHRIKCPKNVDPTQINPECFQDFIPPNVTVIEVKGLTPKQEKKTCRWEITVQLHGGVEVYYDNVKRSNLWTEIDSYKPRNTNLLGEKRGLEMENLTGSSNMRSFASAPYRRFLRPLRRDSV